MHVHCSKRFHGISKNFEVLNLIPKPEVHHANDVTIKYLIDIMPEKLHHYLKLPGNFVRNYSTRLIRRDGSERDMDWLMLVEQDNETLFEKILINVEFQSSYVDKDKIKTIADYRDYSKTYYGLPVLTVIVIMDGFELSELEYSRVPSDILKPAYIRMERDEQIERLNNIEGKILNHNNLSDDEALDVVFLPMFAPKDKAEFVTEKIARLFVKEKLLTGMFRSDIATALSIMVKKYFGVSAKAKELLEMMKPEVVNSRLRDVVEFEVDYIKRSLEQELSEKDEVISEKDEVISEKDVLISEKDNEISMLKAKLEENGIK